MKFGGSGFNARIIEVDESIFLNWNCTSDKITPSGEQELEIIAKVTGRPAVGLPLTREATRTSQ